MTEEKLLYEIDITIHTYQDDFNKFKEKNELTNEEVKERIQRTLQVGAWADVYLGMQDHLDWETSPEGKKFIEEQASQASIKNGGVGSK